MIWRPRRNVFAGQVLGLRGGGGRDDDCLIGGREARVAAEGVAVSDVHCHRRKWSAGVAGEADAEQERCIRPVFGDVAADELDVAVVGALVLLDPTPAQRAVLE